MAEQDYIDELEEHSYKLWKLKDALRKLVKEIESSGTRYDDHIHYKEWSIGLVLKRIKNLLNGGE